MWDLTPDPGRLIGKEKNGCTNRSKFPDIQVPREVEGTKLQIPEVSKNSWGISVRGNRSKGVNGRKFKEQGSPRLLRRAPGVGLLLLDMKGEVNMREHQGRPQQVQNNISERSQFAYSVCIDIRAREPYIVETGNY